MRKQLTAVAVVATATTTLACLTPSVATAADTVKSDVRVVNTPSNPVPVAGQVTVDHAGPVAVAQRQPWQVVVQEPDQPVQVFDPMVMPPGETLLSRTLLEVPAGKRFVAERLSGEALLASENGRIRISLQSDSTPGLVRIPLTPSLGADSGTRAQYNEEVTLYVNGPGRVQAVVQRQDPDAHFTIAQSTTLFGRLVDCATCVPTE